MAIQIEYKKSDDPSWTISSANATSPHTISGLDVETYQLRALNTASGNYSNIIMKAANGEDAPVIASFYVRPAGTIYGTGDGLSYANAWSGFPNIEWGQLGGHTRLWVCGEHIGEVLSVGSNNVTIEFNYPGDPGSIDVNEVSFSGLIVSSKDNVTLDNAIVNNSLGQNLMVSGTSQNLVTNNCNFSYSPDQGIQHNGSVTAIHNNLTIENCADEAVSGHGTAHITINGGNLSNNDKAINHIEESTLILNGPVIMMNNATMDVEVRGDVEMVASFTANNQVFSNGIQATRNGVITLNNCTAPSADVGAVLGGTLSCNQSTVNSIVTANINKVEAVDSRISFAGNSGGLKSFTRCVVQTTGILKSTNWFVRHSLIIGNNVTGSGIIEADEGHVVDFAYSVVRGMIAGQYAFYLKGEHSLIRNLTIVGNGNVGRGVLRQLTLGNATLTNTIFANLELDCVSFSGGTIYLNNCCKFNNTTTGTNRITSANTVTGNPNFVDAPNDNYKIAAGSSCIDTGLDTGFPEGIDTADWGDSEILPVVTTKNQGINYDVGAFIS